MLPQEERVRRLPRAAGALEQHAGRHADRPLGRDRQGARAGARRRRLRHQAVLDHRAAGAGPRRAAPHRVRTSRPPMRSGLATSRWTSSCTRRAAAGCASSSPPASSTCSAISSQHTGQVVTREQILNEVWGYEEFPTTRTIDNFVAKLRQKIERSPHAPGAHPHDSRFRLQVRRVESTSQWTPRRFCSPD